MLHGQGESSTSLSQIVQIQVKLRVEAYSEDEAIFEDQVCQGGAQQKDGRQHNTPDCENAVGLGQLQKLGDLEACQVIH